jgi:hypothetical protein
MRPPFWTTGSLGLGGRSRSGFCGRGRFLSGGGRSVGRSVGTTGRGQCCLNVVIRVTCGGKHRDGCAHLNGFTGLNQNSGKAALFFCLVVDVGFFCFNLSQRAHRQALRACE